jgi:DNA polymerase-4
MRNKQAYIVHVDMDAFFASIEQRDTPSYKNRPVIVGSDPKKGKGRGVVSACSYEARKYGIHSAMPISIAYKKCPNGVFLPVDMKKYAQVSHEIFTLLETFTPEIEPVSIDEAFLDITGSHHLFGGLIETCHDIKKQIKKATGLTASLGLAPNKMTAKIASDIKKPDGFVIVSRQNLLAFLHPLPVEKLWGVGEKTKIVLKGIGINTIGDLAKRDVTALIDIFGKNGQHVWELANGIDPRVVETDCAIKSISNEYTFDKDVREKHKIMDVLMTLSEKVSRRLRKSHFKGKTITLKIRFSDFKTFTRSVSIKTSTNFADIIYKIVLEKLETFDLKTKSVRLIGVGVSNLSDQSWREDLFTENSDPVKKKERIHKALDRIFDKFGDNALKRRSV